MVIIGHRSSKSTFLKGVKGLERAWIHVVSGILIHLIKWLIFVEFTELHWITCHFIAPSTYTLQKGAPGRRTPCCSSSLTNCDAQWFWEHILTSLWRGINLSLSALSPFSISYLIKAGSTTLLLDLCLQSKWCRYREDVRCSEWKPPNTSITLIGLLPKREQWAGPVGGCCKIGVWPSVGPGHLAIWQEEADSKSWHFCRILIKLLSMILASFQEVADTHIGRSFLFRAAWLSMSKSAPRAHVLEIWPQIFVSGSKLF